MKKVIRTLVLGRQVSINTKDNDPVDIRCGGPLFLGFDFTVDGDENKADLESFIKKIFNDSNKYYRSIYVSDSFVEVPLKNIWSRENIKKYIEEYKE